MAVRAEERRHVGLAPRPFDAAEEAAESDGLRSWVAVMELKSGDEALIAADLATTGSLGDRLRLDLWATTLAVADPGLETTYAGIHQWPT